MTRLRKHPNGTLFAPVRGSPPPEVPHGFVRDPNDPFKFLPELVPCEYRYDDIVRTNCCGDSYRIMCRYYNTNVNREICMQCKGVSNASTSGAG